MIIREQPVVVLIALAALVAATNAPFVAAATCLSIDDLHYVSPAQQALHSLDTSSAYFCGPKAPAQFACTCSSSSVCVPHVSAYGTDFGRCGCCPPWLWALAAVFATALAVMMCLAIYTCACKGRWWCDGYHPAIIPLLPARAAPVVVPGQLPLTANVFRGYRRSDFDTGLTPEAAAAAAAATQAAAAAAAAMQQQVANMQQQQQHMLQQLQQHHQQAREEGAAAGGTTAATTGVAANAADPVDPNGPNDRRAVRLTGHTDTNAVGVGLAAAAVPAAVTMRPAAFRGAAGAVSPARSPPTG